MYYKCTLVISTKENEVEKLLAAYKELKEVYENPIQYDEFQYEFLLDVAIQDVIDAYDNEIEQSEMMERFIGE